MIRSKVFTALAVALALAVSATRAVALEKWSVNDTATPQGWSTAATCAIIYYNRCTLWSWAWGGFGAGDRYGVCADACGGAGAGVLQTQNRVFTAAPAGYGFTGTVSLRPADANCCPTGPVLRSQPWLPTGPFDVHNWNVAVPAKFCIVYTFGPNGEGPARIGTDHPAAGPTGPAACGFCYPTSRVNHSFYWGTANTPVCPGSVFNDGVCDAQARVDIFMSPGIGISVEPQSWGGIKSLFR
ncbi:MAG: hypothetical protein U0167_16830 [bacterium]